MNSVVLLLIVLMELLVPSLNGVEKVVCHVFSFIFVHL